MTMFSKLHRNIHPQSTIDQGFDGFGRHSYLTLCGEVIWLQLVLNAISEQVRAAVQESCKGDLYD